MASPNLFVNQWGHTGFEKMRQIDRSSLLMGRPVDLMIFAPSIDPNRSERISSTLTAGGPSRRRGRGETAA